MSDELPDYQFDRMGWKCRLRSALREVTYRLIWWLEAQTTCSRCKRCGRCQYHGAPCASDAS